MIVSDLLRNEDIRIACGLRYLVFDNGKYVVYERGLYKTCGIAVYRGADLSAALNMLQAAI